MENQARVKEYLELKGVIQELQTWGKILPDDIDRRIRKIVEKCKNDSRRINQNIELSDIFLYLIGIKYEIVKGKTYA